MSLFKSLFFFLLLTLPLLSQELERQYSVKSMEFNASHVYPQIKDDFILYRFDDNQHHKAFTADQLVQRFKRHDIDIQNDDPGIIHVQRASEITLDPIIKKIKSYYKAHYPDIIIHDVTIKTNGFIEELPKTYTLIFKPYAYLYHHSSLQLRSKETKQRYFLNYTLKATIKLFKARHNINRGKILARLDLLSVDTEFKRLKSTPLKQFDSKQYRLKKRLSKGKVLYERDIEAVPYVLKDKAVNVRLINGNVRLEFQATCLEDGYKDDHVFIKTRDGKRLRATVKSHNLVEIE